VQERRIAEHQQASWLKCHTVDKFTGCVVPDQIGLGAVATFVKHVNDHEFFVVLMRSGDYPSPRSEQVDTEGARCLAKRRWNERKDRCDPARSDAVAQQIYPRRRPRACEAAAVSYLDGAVFSERNSGVCPAVVDDITGTITITMNGRVVTFQNLVCEVASMEMIADVGAKSQVSLMEDDIAVLTQLAPRLL
jgi:hypothetical protein